MVKALHVFRRLSTSIRNRVYTILYINPSLVYYEVDWQDDYVLVVVKLFLFAFILLYDKYRYKYKYKRSQCSVSEYTGGYCSCVKNELPYNLIPSVFLPKLPTPTYPGQMKAQLADKRVNGR